MRNLCFQVFFTRYYDLQIQYIVVFCSVDPGSEKQKLFLLSDSMVHKDE